MTRAKATNAVLTVGRGRALGRGFVVECDMRGRHTRIVITAAHCLPRLPSSPGELAGWDWTYNEGVLGPLGKKPTVWAECLFVDYVGDIAVLGQPDNQELSEQAEAYDALMDAVTPLPIADAPQDGLAWLLSLDREWNRCRVRHLNGGPNPHLTYHLPSRFRSGDRFGQLPAALAREPRKPAKGRRPR